MDKIISAVKKPWKIVGFVLLGLYYLFFSISLFSGFAGEGAGEIIGGIIVYLLLTGTIGGLVYAIIAHRDDLARFLGGALFAFFIIGALLGIGDTMGYLDRRDGLLITVGVFGMIGALGMAASVVFALLRLFVPSIFRKAIFARLSLIFMAVFLCCEYLVWLFFLIYYGVNGTGPGAYFALFESLAIVHLIVYGYLFFLAE